MLTSTAQLQAFRTRCMKAAGHGITVARADLYLAALEAEAGPMKSPDGKMGSARHLMAMADAALKVRAGGKPAPAAPKKAAPPPPPPPPAPEPEPEPEAAPESEEELDYSSMYKADLVALAEARGLDVKGMTKAEVIEALEADDAE